MSRTASCLLSALLLGAPLPASGAPDEIFTVIRERGAEANAAFSAGDFASAAKLYEAVEALLETVDGREKELAIVRFNLGRCHDELGRPVAAIEAYRRSLDGPLDRTLAGRIRERVEALEAEALGRILVLCDAAEATISVVGRDERGVCGHTFTGISPGPHVVLARTPDGREDRAPAEVMAGVTHEVRVLGGGGGVNWLGWSLAGGAIAALGAGVGFNISAQSSLDEGNRLDRLYQTNRDDATRVARDEADDEAATHGTVSYVLFGVGAGLAVGAAWAFIAGGDDDATALVPLVGPDGLGVVGRF